MNEVLQDNQACFSLHINMHKKISLMDFKILAD